jgi:hypothetical protein
VNENFGKAAIWRLLCVVVLVFVGIAWLLMAFRLLAVAYACVGALGLRFVPSKLRPIALRTLIFGFAILALSPVDISFRTHAGPPKLIPVIYGYPNAAAIEKARRGEAVLGGCLIRGYDPLWVVVW